MQHTWYCGDDHNYSVCGNESTICICLRVIWKKTVADALASLCLDPGGTCLILQYSLDTTYTVDTTGGPIMVIFVPRIF